MTDLEAVIAAAERVAATLDAAAQGTPGWAGAPPTYEIKTILTALSDVFAGFAEELRGIRDGIMPS